MKCPKCEYLGFDTGDRCRHCGYDFSLLAASVAADPDLDLRVHEAPTPASRAWRDQIDAALGQSQPAASGAAIVSAPSAPVSSSPAATSGAKRVPGPALPLFARTSGHDEPLITLPAAPRAPLSVRRTPDTPRPRTVAKHVIKRREPEPILAFVEEPPDPVATEPRRPSQRQGAIRSDLSGPVPRLAAASIDHLLLLAIDVGVVYFTLRMAELTIADWRVLPPLPLIAFLALLKAAYFSAFTAIGGQTIGKMAAGICVVADGGHPIDLTRAVRRTCAGAVSVITLGVGFLPAIIGSERRAFHDRIARTRVVVLKPV